MSPASRRELVEALRLRYRKAPREHKGVILDELCAVAGYHRKYAIHVLNKSVEESTARTRKKRTPKYTARTVTVLGAIWKSAGHRCSIRLKALLPLWMPWARRHFPELTLKVEKQLLAISPRQIDRRLRAKKLALGRHIYGRTKPGALLKHQIPIKTHCWDVTVPGFVEADLVSHSGNDASGEFIYSLNLTDIHTAWGETVAVMGRGQSGVFEALKAIRRALPFTLRGLDCDNGSEFISHHLARKERIGSRVKRVYDKPQTPFDRLVAAADDDEHTIAELTALRERTDPFELSERIGKKLERIYTLAHRPPRSRSGS